MPRRQKTSIKYSMWVLMPCAAPHNAVMRAGAAPGLEVPTFFPIQDIITVMRPEFAAIKFEDTPKAEGNLERLEKQLAPTLLTPLAASLPLAVLIAGEAFLPHGKPDPLAGVIAVAAFVAARQFKVGAAWLVAAGAITGLARLWLPGIAG